MVNYTLGDLIHDSFRVTHGMIAVFPETGHEVTLSVDFFIAKFNGHYSANNSNDDWIYLPKPVLCDSVHCTSHCYSC